MYATIINTVLIIISDRAAEGIRSDETIPLVTQWAIKSPYEIIEDFIVPDSENEIIQAIKTALENPDVHLILTSGGTGFAPRDITPEITQKLIQKFTPGIDEFLRLKGIQKTPHAALSRGISGIAKGKLIINLPGNPQAVIENMQWLQEILPHAIRVMTGSAKDVEHKIAQKNDK